MNENAGAGHESQLDKEGSVWPQFQLEEQSVSQEVSVPRPRVMGPRVATLGFTMLREMSVNLFLEEKEIWDFGKGEGSETY